MKDEKPDLTIINSKTKQDAAFNKGLDPQLTEVVQNEIVRQQNHVELIASENYVSEAVLKLAGTVLTNKYAEGYPKARYYNGCEYVDVSEELARDRFKQLFACGHKPGEKFKDENGREWTCKQANAHANVQPHSGSQANAEAYGAVLKPLDTILGMQLDAGGHLTHGYRVNFSGKTYHGFGYGVSEKDEQLDYDAILELAKQCQPKIIIAGASAYSRTIDFSKFRVIAEEVGAYLMVDMAHIAGLIAAKQHPTPVCHADIITTTTHKTLRGPRGGAILSTAELAKKIDSSVFPGNQGGPLEHIIAAKAQAFYEALTPEFVEYQKQIIKNAKAFAKVFSDAGFNVVAQGTDTHLFTINVLAINGLNGETAVNILEKINIVANKNAVPFDKLPPKITSGVRFGSPAMTTRGFKEQDFEKLGQIIIKAWSLPKGIEDPGLVALKVEVEELLKQFPIYPNMTF
ncbi:serine hydroxymethyltransferase [Spiroplasma platyhelix]|uniref:Serine hydroxymethyltransferase n=1 Tax=Spiroplasma platyhelix PALS-1 TaxID=1276218 RepID=A0A846U297_9MOLU|nr:serine hydroxymethyltransferase [Spiroplasma platyhelix]NKE38639.1 serine hydroxymethyltransferase [Spiroplasma platyhelix PALS-1]